MFKYVFLGKAKRTGRDKFCEKLFFSLGNGQPKLADVFQLSFFLSLSPSLSYITLSLHPNSSIVFFIVTNLLFFLFPFP